MLGMRNKFLTVRPGKFRFVDSSFEEGIRNEKEVGEKETRGDQASICCRVESAKEFKLEGARDAKKKCSKAGEMLLHALKDVRFSGSARRTFVNGEAT